MRQGVPDGEKYNIQVSIARKPGWIWGSLGRDRENWIGTRSMTPNWLSLSKWLDFKLDCVDYVSAAR